MPDIEGLVVLTGKEGFFDNSVLSKKDEIDRIIEQEGNGETFILNNVKCRIRRVNSGVWCGYVGVDNSHPWYGLEYSTLVTIDDISDSINTRNPNNVNILSVMMDMMEDNLDNNKCSISTAIDVHGGITFTGKFYDDDDGLWYFGFDCGHCDDYAPAYSFMSEGLELEYRTKEFVVNECHRLVDQLLIVPFTKGS
jgi:hypothetical protein